MSLNKGRREVILARELNAGHIGRLVEITNTAGATITSRLLWVIAGGAHHKEGLMGACLETGVHDKHPYLIEQRSIVKVYDE